VVACPTNGFPEFSAGPKKNVLRGDSELYNSFAVVRRFKEIDPMESHVPKVLIVDDDPAHLEIYALLVEQARCRPIPAIVRFSGLEYPPDTDIELIILDYRLNSVKTAPDIALEARSRYPGVPVILLSDVLAMPRDVAPFTAKFVRKGEPQKLIDAIRAIMADSAGAPA
jgi:DNA-binding NtrC family response regulator